MASYKTTRLEGLPILSVCGRSLELELLNEVAGMFRVEPSLVIAKTSPLGPQDVTPALKDSQETSSIATLSDGPKPTRRNAHSVSVTRESGMAIGLSDRDTDDRLAVGGHDVAWLEPPGRGQTPENQLAMLRPVAMGGYVPSASRGNL